MRASSIWIIAFLFSISGFSQQQILLRGKIITGQEDAGFIHIINLSEKTGTTNNANGSFEINVKEKDTLLFSSVEFQRQEIIISAETYQEKFLTVIMTQALNQMDEVNISNLSLTGRLNTDLDQIPTINKYNLGVPLNMKPLPSQHDRRIYTATSTSLDLLLNVLSGRLKKLKEEREVFRLISLIDKAEESLPKDFFTDYLELGENDIVNFLYFCAEQSDLRTELSTGNKLALIEYFQGMKERYVKFINEE